MRLLFTHTAFNQFQKLEKSIQTRIDKKLTFYLAQENPLEFAEPLHDARYGTWRFRIGDYRVLFDAEDKTIIILKVGHRRDIYK